MCVYMGHKPGHHSSFIESAQATILYNVFESYIFEDIIASSLSSGDTEWPPPPQAEHI